MARMLRFDERGGYLPQGPVPATPPQRRARWRFRWGRFVGWPLACLLAIAVIRSASRFLADVRPGLTIPKWSFHFEWRSLPETTRLGVLGIVLIAVVALLRTVRDHFRRQ